MTLCRVVFRALCIQLTGLVRQNYQSISRWLLLQAKCYNVKEWWYWIGWETGSHLHESSTNVASIGLASYSEFSWRHRYEHQIQRAESWLIYFSRQHFPTPSPSLLGKWGRGGDERLKQLIVHRSWTVARLKLWNENLVWSSKVASPFMAKLLWRFIF